MTSYVVTGGAQGVGRAIVERVAADGSTVVVVDLSDLGPVPETVRLVPGDASDPEVTARAAAEAEAHGPLVGWVNNAAVFPEASLTSAAVAEVLAGITANLALAVTGCHTAVNHFLTHGRPGAIVNVSSHQAQRPVRGALPYATAKAAIEGLTRALAVDHGPDGIRTNAVALGSIRTARWDDNRAQHPEAEGQVAALHPLGRVGTAAEVAEAVAFLLSDGAGFVNGAVLPVDGGRSVNGPIPKHAEGVSTARDRLQPMPLRTTEDRDRRRDLRAAIDHTGYYPEVVADAVAAALADEPVVSFYVHHEPTFDRDEVRRHLSVIVLTPSRLVLLHTDEHAGDDLLPEPYTSTSTEAIRLSAVKSVVVTRMVANPTSGTTKPAEAVMTIGWGGVSRMDLEPAGCDDPSCEADHGYTGVLSADDFSLRVSAAADGADAVGGLLAFAEQLSARTHA